MHLLNIRNLYRSSVFYYCTIILAPIFLIGCESISKVMGGKSSPDEFSVYSRAPLSIPPEFEIRPPSPGAARPQEGTPRESVKGFLSTKNFKPENNPRNAPSSLSTGEKSLLSQSGGNATDPDIRAIVNRESIVPVSGSKTIANKVLFWKNPKKQLNIVDPQKENVRIRKKQKSGKKITSKGVPEIKKDLDRSLLDILFGG